MRPLACLLVLLPAPLFAQGTRADYDRAAALPQRVREAFGDPRVEPVWDAGGDSFTYTWRVPGAPPKGVRVEAATGARSAIEPDKPAARPKRERRGRGGPPLAKSPDGRFEVAIRDRNVVLVELAAGAETNLTTEGTPADGYELPAYWSPDSSRFVVSRRTAGTDRAVTLIESAPAGGVQPKTSTYRYAKPGDPVPQPKPHLFVAATKAEIPVPDGLFPNPWDISYEGWRDATHFRFVYNQRGHQLMRVVEIDGLTGRSREVLLETSKTFLDYSGKLDFRALPGGDFLWPSERSGVNRLYRVNGRTGELKPLTPESWVLKRIESIDAEAGTAVVRVLGVYAGQDPYYAHFARVQLTGGEPTLLTEADGTHELRFSPDRRYYLDTYSRAELAPVTELRRADGTKVATLEAASSEPLTELGWRAPEPFRAKGRDGATDIYGLIYRPSTFDPAKKYRVIEYVYAGPHDQHVPKAFRAWNGLPQSMAELGFVVVMADGMGTNWRAKAFHDRCWRDLADAGFPDRIAWVKAAAKLHPEMDIAGGVGIFGGSAGGQSAARALLTHHDFYTVAAADCGCHDNRVDKIWWNEQWMGWPLGPWYEACANRTDAAKLKGKLLLTVGELDRNVDPSSTLQLAAALIQADKDFDLVVLPGAGHGAGETPYGKRRRADFFVRHLAGQEPRRE